MCEFWLGERDLNVVVISSVFFKVYVVFIIMNFIVILFVFVIVAVAGRRISE